jgi:hypothetical protein
VGENGFNLAAQQLFVKFEGFFAASVEVQVRIELHNSPFFSLDRLRVETSSVETLPATSGVRRNKLGL